MRRTSSSKEKGYYEGVEITLLLPGASFDEVVRVLERLVPSEEDGTRGEWIREESENGVAFTRSVDSYASFFAEKVQGGVVLGYAAGS